jgi:signal transduction histidine kinase/ligand-binding sensor domain-containing protein
MIWKKILNLKSKILNRAVLLIFSVLSIQPAFAQYFQSTNFREGTGLPSSETYMVYQDTRGFIWIATDNGVVKYDGREFVTYNVLSGLSDNTVFGFHEDSKGRIWFRTYNGALSYYEGDTIRSYKHNAVLKKYIGSGILSDIEHDSLGYLHFNSASTSALAVIDSTGKITNLYGNYFPETHFSERFDDMGRAWHFLGLLKNNAVVEMEGAPRNIDFLTIGGKKYEIDLDDRESQRTWLMGSVKWKGRYYISMHKNIFSFDGQSLRKVYTAREPLISLYVDHEDRLWAGCFNDGVRMFKDESVKEPFSLRSLSNLSVSSVIQDYEGGMWISTLDQGVFYFPNLKITNYPPPNSTRINAVASDGDEVFLGNYSGEVFRMTRKGDVKLITKVVPPINNLFLDSENKLWISEGTGTRIHQSGRFVGTQGGNQSKTMKALVETGDFLIGCSSNGFYALTLDGKVMKQMDVGNRPISIAVVGGQIYLGGLNGLEKWDLDFSGSFEKLSESRTSTLHKLDERFLAVGTIGKGLHIYDCKGQKMWPLPIADVSNIYSMISNWVERRMWIGTDKGLFQLDFQMDTSGLVLDQFAKADGLISNKVNKLCWMGDDIWAISDLGISRVSLEHFGERDFVPKFYINRILFQDQSLAVNSNVVKTSEEDMMMEVRPISFKGHPTVFRYRLSEDEPWTMVSGGSIFLVDMKPNRYHVEIQASTGNSGWAKGLTLQLEITADWWETWAFKIAAVLSVIILGYVAYLLRVAAIKRKGKYLELITLHQQKLIDSEIRTQERERKRIAGDLHDGIGATLSSIKLQIADAMNDSGDENLTRTKEITDNLTDVIDDIKRIVYDLHPPSLERYGLQAGLKSFVERLNKNTDINVIFDYYGQRDVKQPVSVTIFRILQELVNNTLKHARASEIRIHINEFEGEINIMYEDNGIGMVGSRFTGLGLHSIESRVRSLNGRMTWESNHKGTFYNFDIPF